MGESYVNTPRLSELLGHTHLSKLLLKVKARSRWDALVAPVAPQHLLDSVRLSLTQAVLSTPPPLKQADRVNQHCFDYMDRIKISAEHLLLKHSSLPWCSPTWAAASLCGSRSLTCAVTHSSHTCQTVCLQKHAWNTEVRRITEPASV